MRADFLIVGGGVVGLAAAYHLKRARPESSVLLLERSPRLCSGNSGRSAALYRNLFLSGTSRALAEASIAQYREIAEAISLKPIGYLWAFDAAAWSSVKEGAARLSALAREVELLEGPELAAATAAEGDGKAYPRAAGAILGRNCGALSAQALTAWYAEGFQELGGRIEMGAEVLGFELAPGVEGLPGRIKAARLASRERAEAERFLVAAGCWLQDLLGPLGIASAVYPKKRQLFGISVPEASELYGEERVGRPALILPFGGIYLKPVLERGIVVAGRADDLGRSIELPYGSGKAEAEEGYFRQHVEPALRAYFPRLAARFPRGLELRQAWAGHYDYYWPDKNPVLERAANLFWVGGSSGSGIMKGDSLGRLAAAALLDEERTELADGRLFEPAALSLRARDVENEGLVI